MRIHPDKIIENLDTNAVLAHRLESIRNDKGFSLDELAALTDISRSTLSRIERGETSPTANVLGRLCAVYEITMSQLLSAIEPDLPRHLKFSDAKKWLDSDSGFTRVALSPPAENYNIEVTWGELLVGSGVSYEAPPKEGLEQHLILLEGNLELTFDETSYQMEPMDCLALKLHGASQFRNLGSIPAQYLVINSKTL